MASGPSTEDKVSAESTSTAVPGHITIDVEDINQKSTDVFEIDISTHPFYAKIKRLSQLKNFRDLEHLAQWMRIGMSPESPWGLSRNMRKREEHWNRTNVTLVEYRSMNKPIATSFTNIEDLKEALQNTTKPSSLSSPDDAASVSNVLLVEDLSREIIEILGSRYDVDPNFFGSHIQNQPIHDHMRNRPGRDHKAFGSQRLLASKMRQQWFQISNTRLRFHETPGSYHERIWKDCYKFNVFRVMNYDFQSTFGYESDMVSIRDTKTSVWVGKDKWNKHGNIGIVLVDPTITAGYTLSYDRDACVSMSELDGVDTPTTRTSMDSWHNDLIEMTVRYPWFESLDAKIAVDPLVMVYPVVFTTCAEWLNVCEWVKVRLGSIETSFHEAEVSSPTSDNISTALAKLETWRGQLPIWKEKVTETLEESLLIAARLMTGETNPPIEQVFADILPDFKRVIHTLDTLQIRTDRLVHRGTATMQLIAAQQSLAESHNLARLTWLATIFIPMTFMTGLFSMNDNITSLRPSFKTYFIVAIPVAIFALLVARWGPDLMRPVRKMSNYALRPIVDYMFFHGLYGLISSHQLDLFRERQRQAARNVERR